MKLKFIYTLGLVGLMAASTSCHREYFNPAPQNTLFDANAFSSAARGD